MVFGGFEQKVAHNAPAVSAGASSVTFATVDPPLAHTFGPLGKR